MKTVKLRYKGPKPSYTYKNVKYPKGVVVEVPSPNHLTAYNVEKLTSLRNFEIVADGKPDLIVETDGSRVVDVKAAPKTKPETKKNGNGSKKKASSKKASNGSKKE